jgi:RecB family exonuclease
LLSCTDWERALARPELVWMEHYLGVTEPRWNAAEMPDALLVGNWVHRWLHRALGFESNAADAPNLHPLPDGPVLRERILAACHEVRVRAQRAFAEADRSLPRWWSGLLTQARVAALELAEAIAAARDAGWPLAASEWALPAGTSVPLTPAVAPVPVTGRMDLILAAAANGPFCVVDYKTGAAPSLTPATLAAGQGVQLLLYALALRGRGLNDVAVAAASPGNPIEPRSELGEWLADERVAGALAAIGRMQATAVFGVAGDPRAEFGYCPAYPLAWLPVNAEVLRRKRALTLA